MSETEVPAKTWFITFIIVALIVYGSLYPFDFRIPSQGKGAFVTFLGTWNARPGLGDFVANVLLYLPFGCFFLLGLRRDLHLALRLPLTVFTGAALSLGVELTQYYDTGRDTEATDFYANSLGSCVGALLACVIGSSLRGPLSDEVVPRPVLLIFAWLAYRLYPYVPTINMTKYWNALGPIILRPSLNAYDLFRQAAIWLTLCTLIDAAVLGQRSVRLVLLFAVSAFCAKVLIIGTQLRVAELAGFGVAFIVWLGLLRLPARARMGIAGVVLCVYVVALRLEPFQFLPVARQFSWVPFHSLMFGSLTVDTLAFLEKFFLYGSLLYLFETACGGHRLAITVFVAALLLATSCIEVYLPDRSAEITDTLMVLIIAATFALLPRERVTRTKPPDADNSRNYVLTGVPKVPRISETSK